MTIQQNTKKSPGFLALILLELTLTVSFLQINNIFTFPLMAMWIALAVAKMVANIPKVREKYPLTAIRKKLSKWGVKTENQKKQGGVLRTFLTWNFGSQVAVYLYTILLVVFQLTESRFLSTNIMTFINGLSAASIVYLFGKRGVYASISALCLAWLISVVRTFVSPAFDNFWKNLELHDMSFGAGYILLYYIFCHRRWSRYHVVCCTVVALLILLAFKRIGLAALALTVVLWGILRIVKTEKKRRAILLWGSVAAVVVCYLFVWVIVEGWLISFLESVGINPMGRNYYYAALASHCEFTPGFLGLGRNASATLFSMEYASMRVGNVHSDILRMYAECGFVLFGLWLLIFWLFLPRQIGKKYGYRPMEFFVLCTVYTFIVYATDNTELYLVNQYFYMLMTMHVALTKEQKPAPLEGRVVALYGLLKNEAAARAALRLETKSAEKED